MKINEIAKRTGVTVRTLHYYDEIGLLKPAQVTNAGYRVYGEDALESLQQILFFRELDFSLQDIKAILQSPAYRKEEALIKHREILLQKRDRINRLIALLDLTIKGGKDMSFEQFDTTEIEKNKKKYAEEVKARWGSTDAYRESEAKAAGYSSAQWQTLGEEGKAILKAFGENRHLAPGGAEAQALVARWQAYITANFYRCTKEILSALGLMYTGDARFTENIDKNGAGTAAFMAAAIEIYCTK